MPRKPYICYACRDGHHNLCAFDLNPKKLCRCNRMWHVEVQDGGLRRFKGDVLQVISRPTPSAPEEK